MFGTLNPWESITPKAFAIFCEEMAWFRVYATEANPPSGTLGTSNATIPSELSCFADEIVTGVPLMCTVKSEEATVPPTISELSWTTIVVG